MSNKRVDVVNIQLVKEKSIIYEGRVIKNPLSSYILVKDFLKKSDREKFMVVCLNANNEPINICTICIGALNQAYVSPMDVMKPAILSNSNKIILAHNHPSGDSHPSDDDCKITENMKQAGKILGIEILDHIIVAGDECFSFLEGQSFVYQETIGDENA